VDLECSDNHKRVTVWAIKMSPVSQYLVVNSSDTFGVRTTVWGIAKEINLSMGSMASSWARKLILVSTDKRDFSNTTIAFEDEGFLHCPYGQINLQTGIEQSSLFQRAKAYDFRYLSNDSSAMMVAPLNTLYFIESDGTVQSSEPEEPPRGIYGVTSRYGVWHDKSTYHVYDAILCKSFRLQTSRIGDCHFSRDNKWFYIIVSETDVHYKPQASIFVWSLQNETIELCATRKLTTKCLASYLERDGHVLHLIVEERIWREMRLTGHELIEVDAPATVLQYSHVEHCISGDGTRLAVFHLGPGRYVSSACSHYLALMFSRANIQMVDQVHECDIIFGHELKMPECNFDTAVVVFSPGLELIYVGNYVILMLDPLAQPLLLPLPFVRTETYSSRRLDWSFGFSACAQYFALAANPVNGGVEAARLCIFKVDVGNSCS
jgi:hypothetical protein